MFGKTKLKWALSLVVAAVILSVAGCSSSSLVIAKPLGYAPPVGTNPGKAGNGTPLEVDANHDIATFSAGNFMDAEARFRAIPGVTATAVGYEGGEEQSPTYPEVTTERTHHALVVLVEFNPKKVSYNDLLTAFFNMHDPTALNHQGDMHGEFVRSAIFYHTTAQRDSAAYMIRKLSDLTGMRLQTYLVEERRFWLAEGQYQQHHEKNGTLPAPEPTWRQS